MAKIPVRRALVSVSDKSGLLDLARRLAAAGVELVSSGGTAAAIREAGIPVTPVAEVTGAPEMLGGRVKTLHPRIHGGILADPGRPEHREDLAAQGIEPFQLVVANLYPFEETVARPGVSAAEAVEQIDIGGPAMLRAAAKNHKHVIALIDAADYPEFLRRWAEDKLDLAYRRRLAAKAFAHTASYDAAIAAYLATDPETRESRTG